MFTWIRETKVENGSVGEYWILGDITVNPNNGNATVPCELYLSQEEYEAGATPLKSETFHINVMSLTQNGALGNAVVALIQAKQDA